MTRAPRSAFDDLKRDRHSTDRRWLPRPLGALSHLIAPAFAGAALVVPPGRVIDLVAAAE
jgi:hypothetical protein